MKAILPRSRRFRDAFTLVELLTVIAIIAILASMLLVVLTKVSVKAKEAKAKLEISQIVTAIQGYDSAYGRLPVSKQAQTVAAQNQQAGGDPDFTYGGAFLTPSGTMMNIGTAVDGSGDVLSNNEVVAILMDLTNYPNGGGWTVNTNYQSNPQQTAFLNATMSGWGPGMPGDPQPGVGTDLVYRDPWGDPYIITLDLNYDEMCEDAFYRFNAVSGNSAGGGSWNGLVPCANDTANASLNNNWAFRGKAMVWSAGPDKKVDPGGQAGGPNPTANTDNVLSWK